MEFSALRRQVENVLNETAVADIHTHLYSESFGELLLWGIDALLTYHYMVPELLRHRQDLTAEAYFGLSTSEQAELVWQEVFVKRTPISEAARGIATVLHELGIDTSTRDLSKVRGYFAEQSVGEHINRVFELARVKYVVMTNDPFDAQERSVWGQRGNSDMRFKSALRLDGLLNAYGANVEALQAQGFAAEAGLAGASVGAVKDFLKRWIERISPEYMAVSLGPEFRMDDGSVRARLLRECVLPVAEAEGLPVAMMIGVKKLQNPALELAGDGVGKADVDVVADLAKEWSGVRFLVTMLSRENQHELCVAARKFRNLLVFGCWWFLNNPSIISEMTLERVELLGWTTIPQHSDARVLEQLIYKWQHTREVLTSVLAKKYYEVMQTGWPVRREDMVRDVEAVLGGKLLGRG